MSENMALAGGYCVSKWTKKQPPGSPSKTAGG